MSTPGTEEEEDKLRERAFYSAMVTAWLNTKLERDKQLLGLSVISNDSWNGVSRLRLQAPESTPVSPSASSTSSSSGASENSQPGNQSSGRNDS